MPAEYVSGYDVRAIRVLGCEVSFSYEEPGIQVSFVKGQADGATALAVVEEVLQNITRATGQAGTVVQISV